MSLSKFGGMDLYDISTIAGMPCNDIESIGGLGPLPGAVPSDLPGGVGEGPPEENPTEYTISGAGVSDVNANVTYAGYFEWQLPGTTWYMWESSDNTVRLFYVPDGVSRDGGDTAYWLVAYDDGTGFEALYYNTLQQALCPVSGWTTDTDQGGVAPPPQINAVT